MLGGEAWQVDEDDWRYSLEQCFLPWLLRPAWYAMRSFSSALQSWVGASQLWTEPSTNWDPKETFSPLSCGFWVLCLSNERVNQDTHLSETGHNRDTIGFRFVVFWFGGHPKCMGLVLFLVVQNVLTYSTEQLNWQSHFVFAYNYPRFFLRVHTSQ